MIEYTSWEMFSLSKLSKSSAKSVYMYVYMYINQKLHTTLASRKNVPLRRWLNRDFAQTKKTSEDTNAIYHDTKDNLPCKFLAGLTIVTAVASGE